MAKKKISELPLASSLIGLFTIGVDAANKSVKVSLEWLKTAYDNVAVAISNANNATSAANTAAGHANDAVIAANNKIAETEATRAAAVTATNNAKSVSDHPGYIGAGYHVYQWNYTIEQYVQTERVLRPEGFNIHRVYTSVSAMESDRDNVPEGKFVIINTGNVEDPDTAKLYVKGASDFEYLVDMSGAVGFTGKTPQPEVGTTVTGSPETDAQVTISEGGVDDEGNPIFRLNFVIPRGKSEVQTSTEEPTDPDVTIWFNPEGDADGDFFENLVSYGVKLDLSSASPTLSRIGNSSLHAELPIQSRMKGCLLADDGSVIEYLGNNWNSHVLDGTNGQVMVEIPAHYRKFRTDGNYFYARISEYPLEGYHKVPKMYVSAFEAVRERSTNKLCSVINLSADYRGGGNQTAWDGTYRSQLGVPVTATSRTNYRTYARNRGTKWNCYTYEAHKAIAWLFYIEYATLNSQLPINSAKTAAGFAQGGLGNGCTTMNGTAWNNFNGYYPLIPCGYTNSLGDYSGEVAYELKDGDGNMVATLYPNRYRGIENPFGHLWKWTDGINIEVKTDADGGTSKVYVALRPDLYNDTNYDGFQMRGLLSRSEGYVKKMLLGEYGDLMPSAIGGGSTTWWCDYLYTSVASSSLRCVLFGGAADYGAFAGFGCANASNAPSSTTATFGSRLCFIYE